MTEFSHDGHPIQAGAAPSDFGLTGHRPHFSIIGLREMVVIDRKYVDQPGNRSQTYVEYTCRDLYTGEVYPGCRRLVQMGGYQNGDDSVLHPSTTILSGTVVKKNLTPAKDVDGDQVLVGFLEGSRSKPVILGVFQHSSSKYGAKSTDGERRITRHAGASLEFKADGTVNVVPNHGSLVHLGDAAATDAVVRGTTYRNAEDTLIAALNTFVIALAAYATAIKPVADPSNVGTTTFTTACTTMENAISAFKALAASYLSTKVNVST